MTDKIEIHDCDVIATWVKRCYLAIRAAMDDALRPYDLGATQWYVLSRLAEKGPAKQRELQRLLQVERATLSAVVGVMVRKGLISQVPDPADQRQKLLEITAGGMALWHKLPDLGAICKIAFGGLDADAIIDAVLVLQTATDQLEELIKDRGSP